MCPGSVDNWSHTLSWTLVRPLDLGSKQIVEGWIMALKDIKSYSLELELLPYMEKGSLQM